MDEGMILDKILIEQLPRLGNTLMRDCNIRKSSPENLNELRIFLERLKKGIESDEFESAIIGRVIYSFISSSEVRDRNTTSRNFEDIFSHLFSSKPTDSQARVNPEVSPHILELDKLTINEDWQISKDLASNKREKIDVMLGDYGLSVKTLKGISYDINGKIIDKTVNKELNVGSFSYRALFKGIFSDEYLNTLGDRKSGLGSSKQIREKILSKILEEDKKAIFLERFKLLFSYVYEEDIVIVIKSNFKILFYLIPNNSFVSTFFDAYESESIPFERILNRWENNNLRISLVNLLEAIDKFGYDKYLVEINLGKSLSHKGVSKFFSIVEEAFKAELEFLIK
jgi:hypothetical protein